MKCEHGKERTRCKDCGGGSYCEHERIRGTCSLCSPEKVFRKYQRDAIKNRHLSFSLSLEEFEKLVAAPCFYCGENYEPRGLDRRDNRIGYNLRNVVPCCFRCNRNKSNDPESVFLGHVRRIQQHQEKLRLKSEIDRGGIAGVAPIARSNVLTTICE